jgi:hypothetical protein
MQAAIEIFVNGIFGVFTGLAVLYVAIKANTLLAGRKTEKKEE